MIRRPPRSTLFPTRRSSDLPSGRPTSSPASSAERRRSSSWTCTPRRPASRSEEHTSELQSRLHLVCRLLLEKKKTVKRLDNQALLLEEVPDLSRDQEARFPG